MGYSGPNPMACMLRTGRTGAIGLVFSERLPYAFDDATAIALLQGVAQVCERVAASLLILPAVDNDAAENTVRNAAVDGFIFPPTHYRVHTAQLPDLG
jgi:DNA-binding LacI/PurR family transcriptional regulator